MERKIIKASEGMILTDGKTYGTEVYLAEGIDETQFKEITLEEYFKLTEPEEESYE